MLRILAVFLLMHALTVHAHQASSQDIVERLEALEGKLKDEVHELKDKIFSLEKEVSELKSQSVVSPKRRVVSNPSQEVAFSARLGLKLSNLVDNQLIEFTDVITNIGNHYNSATGIFHVPVSGRYLLFSNILSEAGHSIETEMVRNGDNIADIYSGGPTNFNGPGSNLVILQLDQGDDVMVRVHGHYSTNMGVHCCWSTFSGYLLQTD